MHRNDPFTPLLVNQRMTVTSKRHRCFSVCILRSSVMLEWFLAALTVFYDAVKELVTWELNPNCICDFRAFIMNPAFVYVGWQCFDIMMRRWFFLAIMRFYAQTLIIFLLKLSSIFTLKCDCNNTNSGAYAAQYQTTINLITQLTNRQIAPIQCNSANVCEVNDSILLSKAGFFPTCLKMASTHNGGTEFKHCTYWKGVR